MLTGQNGILTQAQKAGEQTEIGQEKEAITLAYNGAKAEERGGVVTADKLDKELEKDGADAIQDGTNIKVTFRESGREYIIDENGTITEVTETTPPTGDDNEATVGEIVQLGEGNKEYTSGEYTAIIPEGFMIVPGLNNIEEGLVISDNASDTEADESKITALGNQFVWVPVPEFTEFKRYDFEHNTEVSNDFIEESADGIANTTEVEKMYKSVKDNKGFYIGRYEAGNDGSANAISKKNKNPYVNIKWGNSMSDETGGAVEKARNFSTQSRHTNVTSTLVYGVQWDAVMRWISENEKLAGYLTDSTGKGNYNKSNTIPTGSNPEYQLKNIYDMAGNVYEWTMEKVNDAEVRAIRGGVYIAEPNSGGLNGAPCSCRSGYPVYVEEENLGFRIAIYL